MNPLNGGYDESQPMTDLVKFPDADPCGLVARASPTIAPSGGTFLNGAKWARLGPARWPSPCSRASSCRCSSWIPRAEADGEWVRITDRGRLRVASKAPTATSTSPPTPTRARSSGVTPS